MGGVQDNRRGDKEEERDMYVSTRGGERATASEAILKGLASDGGLFVPEKIEKINFDGAHYRKDIGKRALNA